MTPLISIFVFAVVALLASAIKILNEYERGVILPWAATPGPRAPA